MLHIAQNLSKSSGFDLEKVMAQPGKSISLSKDFDPAYTGTFKDKSETQTELAQNIELLATQQDVLYADDRFALLFSTAGQRRNNLG